MAGIDKIYGSQEQYKELKNWLEKNEDWMWIHIGTEITNISETPMYEWVKPSSCLYPEDPEHYRDSEYRPISNFPEPIDMWLLEYCPLDWVIERIKEQYNLNEEYYG